MSKRDTIRGTVVGITRHGHTVYGNPMISVDLRLDGVEDYLVDYWVDGLRISDNAGLVYEIENSEYRDAPHTFALTRAGRISHVIREA